MRIKLIQIDGALPNLALMKLAHWHRAQGDEVLITRRIEPDLFEGAFDRVYGSAIFRFSAERTARFLRCYPQGILGGTGTDSPLTVEEWLHVPSYEHYDYEGWDVAYSLGFTQRGCRLRCKFCVVPTKEGRNRSTNTIEEIWRGAPHPRHLHLLDNDFFGQPERSWRARVEELRTGHFRVCLSQGINVRLITPEAAAALAQIEYRDTKFQERRLYTAWDNLNDERAFFRGIDRLSAAGIPEKHLMVYMLVGFDPQETWPRIWHRFNAMVERGIRPYPMVFDRSRADLRRFQRWVVTGLYRAVPWSKYLGSMRREQVACRLGRATALESDLFGRAGSLADPS
jgi:hypothetical protein